MRKIKRKNPHFEIIISDKIRNKKTIDIFKSSVMLFEYELSKYKTLNTLKKYILIQYIPVKGNDDRMGEYEFHTIRIFESNVFFIDTKENFKSQIDPAILKMTFTLFHEFGHLYYREIMTVPCKNFFNKYVKMYTRNINLEKLNKLLEKYDIEEINLKFPLLGTIIDHVQSNNLTNKYESIFIRPLSSYMPNNEELFCELFARYMIRDFKNKHPKIKFYQNNFNVIETLITNSCPVV